MKLMFNMKSVYKRNVPVHNHNIINTKFYSADKSAFLGSAPPKGESTKEMKISQGAHVCVLFPCKPNGSYLTRKYKRKEKRDKEK